MKYFQNYTSTVHGLGLDVYAGINEIDYDFFPGAPNVTVSQVEIVAKRVAAMAKAGGFDGAISDFEPVRALSQQPAWPSSLISLCLTGHRRLAIQE